jgi:hypothetical protein
MIITQKSLPRRTFLKGIGTAVALPFLDAMIPAARAQSLARPLRMAFVYVPNGIDMPLEPDLRWRTAGTADSEIAEPMEKTLPLGNLTHNTGRALLTAQGSGRCAGCI